MKRILSALGCLLLLLALLCPVGTAVTDQTLDLKIREYMQEHGLKRENFSLSYALVKSGDVVNYNGDVYIPTGSLWIFPMHMYYYKMETTGELEKTLEYGQEEYTIDGMTLQECRVHSITLGETNVSITMRENLGDLQTYLELVNNEFSLCDPLDLPEEYWTGKNYSTKYLTGCMLECSKHPEYFPQMLKAFQEVQTGEGFTDYSASIHVYETTKLRSEQNGWICETAQVNTTTPFVITAFITNEIVQPDGSKMSGDRILAELRDLICIYLEELAGVEEQQSGGSTDREREDAVLLVNANTVNRKELALKWTGIALGGAAVLAGIVWLIYYLIRRYHNRDYDDF